MSYPFSLRFLVGRLLVDEIIEEKVCVVENEAEDTENSDNLQENGPNEIWSSDELDNTCIENTIGLLEFKIGANQSTYNPEFRLLRTENYDWTTGRDGIKDTLNNLDRGSTGRERQHRQHMLKQRQQRKTDNVYRLYYILSSKIPPGIVSGITKRFGKNLLEQMSTVLRNNELSKGKIFWCILLKPKQVKIMNKVIPYKMKFDPFLGETETIDESAFLLERLQFDILGESLSTNCAEIEYVF